MDVDKGIIYYTDNELPENLAEHVRESISESMLPITSVSLRPIDFGQNIVLPLERSYLTLFKQVLVALWASTADYVFMCEHDVLYHPSHFEFDPPRDDVYYYNNNVYKWRLSDNKVVGYDCWWLSQLCASRKLLIKHYTRKIQMIESEERRLWNWRFEPGTKAGIDEVPLEWFESEFPNIDMRHGKNLTGMKRFDPSEFRGDVNKVCPNFVQGSLELLDGWDSEELNLLRKQDV